METDTARTAGALRELAALLRVSTSDSITRLLKAELTKEPTLRAYQATDGQASQQEVARRAAIGQATVSRLWQRWLGLGLAVEGEEGRAKALFAPELYGVTLKSIDATARQATPRAS